MTKPTGKSILKAVSEATGVPVSRLRGGSLDRKTCTARHAGMFVARSLGHTLLRSARMFRRSDHTITLYAERRFQESDSMRAYVYAILKCYEGVSEESQTPLDQ